MVTVASGTPDPDGSRIVPEIVPVCALKVAQKIVPSTNAPPTLVNRLKSISLYPMRN
jgi:hypothetical protein